MSTGLVARRGLARSRLVRRYGRTRGRGVRGAEGSAALVPGTPTQLGAGRLNAASRLSKGGCEARARRQILPRTSIEIRCRRRPPPMRAVREGACSSLADLSAARFPSSWSRSATSTPATVQKSRPSPARRAPPSPCADFRARVRRARRARVRRLSAGDGSSRFSTQRGNVGARRRRAGVLLPVGERVRVGRRVGVRAGVSGLVRRIRHAAESEMLVYVRSLRRVAEELAARRL